ADGRIGKGLGVKPRRVLGVAVVPKANRVLCWLHHVTSPSRRVTRGRSQRSARNPRALARPTYNRIRTVPERFHCPSRRRDTSKAPHDKSQARSISSPGAASPPCAILEEGVSLPSPGAKATTLRCAARPPALRYSPPQFGQAHASGSARYLLPKSPAPSRSSVRVARWCGRSLL